MIIKADRYGRYKRTRFNRLQRGFISASYRSYAWNKAEIVSLPVDQRLGVTIDVGSDFVGRSCQHPCW